MNAHTTPTRDWQATIVQAQAIGAMQVYASLERTALHLPPIMQVKLIRALIPGLSGSYGADDLHKGCDTIEDDLNDAQRAHDGEERHG